VIGHEIAASNYESDNFRRQLRSSFMYSNMRKPSMSQNDPDENHMISLEPSLMMLNNSEECKQNGGEYSDSPKIILSDNSDRFDNFTSAS